MINKVDLNNYYNNYQVGGVKKPEESQIPFPLNDNEPGVIYEPSGKKPEDKIAGDKAHSTMSEQTRGVSAQDNRDLYIPGNETKADQTEESGITSFVKTLFMKAVSYAKNVFDLIWNGEAGKVKNQEETDRQEAEVSSEMTADQSEDFLKQILKKRDMAGLESYLTENGAKKPARNSDLLTFYNRQGKIVAVDPSDKRRILQGDFRDIKL